MFAGVAFAGAPFAGVFVVVAVVIQPLPPITVVPPPVTLPPAGVASPPLDIRGGNPPGGVARPVPLRLGHALVTGLLVQVSVGHARARIPETPLILPPVLSVVPTAPLSMPPADGGEAVPAVVLIEATRGRRNQEATIVLLALLAWEDELGE